MSLKKISHLYIVNISELFIHLKILTLNYFSSVLCVFINENFLTLVGNKGEMFVGLMGRSISSGGE